MESCSINRRRWIGGLIDWWPRVGVYLQFPKASYQRFGICSESVMWASGATGVQHSCQSNEASDGDCGMYVQLKDMRWSVGRKILTIAYLLYHLVSPLVPKSPAHYFGKCDRGTECHSGHCELRGFSDLFFPYAWVTQHTRPRQLNAQRASVTA